ncbi:MAG: EAL domain-containing protein [Christensenella sp.]|nr:EAL domain-containing protein [Christensenella sp.]
MEVNSQKSKNNCKLIGAALATILENTMDMMFVKDEELVYRGASRAFAKMVGLENSEDAIGKTDFELFDDQQLARRYTDDDKKLLAEGRPMVDYVEPIRPTDSRPRYCQTSKYILYDENRRMLGILGVGRDITREYEAKLNYEKELASFFEMPDGVLAAALFDVADWRVVDIRVRDGSTAYFGTIEEFTAFAGIAVAQDEGVKEFFRSFSQESVRELFDSGKRNFSLEYLRHLQNGMRWVRDELHFLTDPVNGHLCVVIVLRDINDERRAADELAREAKQDGMTGLLNRKETMNRIGNYLNGEGKDGMHALFMIDVDNFKAVNDTFGHQMGDRVLIEIGERIREIFRDSDVVGRIGGDEFFVLMKSVSGMRVVQNRAEELLEALQYVCDSSEKRVMLSGSIGISVYHGAGKSVDDLYSQADAALYEAKREGKNRYVCREKDIQDAPKEHEPINTIHLQSLLENMDGIVFLMDIQDDKIKIVYSSRSIPAKKECKDTFSSLVTHEDAQRLRSAILEAAKTGRTLDHIYRVNENEGQIGWRHIRGSLLPSRGDGVCRMINVVSDVTDQKRAEEKLRQNSQIIEAAMKNTDINFWIYDLRTKECMLSENCRRVHGMQKEVLQDFPECIGDSGYLREDCVGPINEGYQKLREAGVGFEMDAWYRNNRGVGWWCEHITVTPIFSENNEPRYAVAIGKNVTEMKKMQSKYQAFRNYRKLAQNNTVASFRMNLTTNWCGDGRSKIEDSQDLCQAQTVDDFFEILYQNIPVEAELTKYKEVFSREGLLRQFEMGETSPGMEFRYSTQDERKIWMRCAAEMMRNPVTGAVEALFYAYDIDYEKNMKVMIDKLVRTDYEFLMLMDAKTGRILVSGESALTGQSWKNHAAETYDKLLPGILKGLVVDEDYEECLAALRRAHLVRELERKEIYTCSFSVKQTSRIRAGRKQWKCGYLDESKAKILVTRADITDVFSAERDELTGIYNRQAFYRHARAILDENPQEKFVLIRFDIDRFKAYNDLYGTQAGDMLLSKIGKLMKKSILTKDAITGRIVSDHFAVLAPAEYFDIEEWRGVGRKWIKKISPDYHLKISTGIYEITDRDIDVSLMSDRALLALLTVKQNYSKKIAWYDESLRQTLVDEHQLIEEMEQALIEEQFVVYFQPQVDYDEGTLIGAEALVRWQHPTRGLIPPDRFIPLFEKNGFISKLDVYVWEKSCQYLRKWMSMDGRLHSLTVAVNISRYDIYDPKLCETLEALVRKYALPPSALKLEITESAYMEDAERLIEVVNQLQSLGFLVEMDDFGAGYSSLNILKDVPVNLLKLDLRFLSQGKNDARGGSILSSVIRMAHWLKLPVIAEGVETKMQADYLRSLNCSYMQGYYFGKPMPAEEFEAYAQGMTIGLQDRYRGVSIGGASEFLDPSTQMTMLFNSFVGGAAILEYCKGNAEIIRANDEFYKQLGTTRKEYLSKQKRILERFDEENRKIYKEMLEKAILTGAETECVIRSLPHVPGGDEIWTHNRVRLLADNLGSYLFYLVVENITKYKKMEQELERLRGKDKG